MTKEERIKKLISDTVDKQIEIRQKEIEKTGNKFRPIKEIEELDEQMRMEIKRIVNEPD